MVVLDGNNFLFALDNPTFLFAIVFLYYANRESTRRQIEEETGVKLILPFASSEDTCVGNNIKPFM